MLLKNLLRPLLPPFVRRWRINYFKQIEFNGWEKAGKPYPPPPVVKERAILLYRKKSGIKTLIETGTCYGSTIEAVKHRFENIFSVELNDKLHEFSKRRFKDNKKIHLFKGDSGKLLPEIIKDKNFPCLFWLDAHYSGSHTSRTDLDTPIEPELKILLARKEKDIILIDDARLFNGTDDYPTLDKVRSMAEQSGKRLSIEVKDDIIRIFSDAGF